MTCAKPLNTIPTKFLKRFPVSGTVLETALSSLFLLLMDEFDLIILKERFELSLYSFLDCCLLPLDYLSNLNGSRILNSVVS